MAEDAAARAVLIVLGLPFLLNMALFDPARIDPLAALRGTALCVSGVNTSGVPGTSAIAPQRRWG